MITLWSHWMRLRGWCMICSNWAGRVWLVFSLMSGGSLVLCLIRLQHLVGLSMFTACGNRRQPTARTSCPRFVVAAPPVGCPYRLCRVRSSSSVQSCACWGLSCNSDKTLPRRRRRRAFGFSSLAPLNTSMKCQRRYSNRTLPPHTAASEWSGCQELNSAPRCSRWEAALSNCCCGSPRRMPLILWFL